MLDFTIIFKLAGLGICLAVINTLLDNLGGKELKFPITVACVIMGLLLILDYVRQLFDIVQTFAM